MEQKNNATPVIGLLYQNQLGVSTMEFTLFGAFQGLFLSEYRIQPSASFFIGSDSSVNRLLLLQIAPAMQPMELLTRSQPVFT